MKKVKNNSVVPNGGTWTYKDRETGFVIQHPYFNVIVSKATAYRQANSLPIGINWLDEVEEILCENAAPGTCLDFTPPTFGEQMVSVGHALMEAAKTGFKVVDQSEYQRRLDLCKDCNFFGGLKGLLRVVCRQCNCSNKKLNLGSSHCPLPQPKW